MSRMACRTRVCAVVRQYVGYRMEGFSPGLHRGLPSRHLTFLVSVGGPIETVAVPPGSHLPALLQALVGGLQTGPTLVRHDGNDEGSAVELTPVGARSGVAVVLAENRADMAREKHRNGIHR